MLAACASATGRQRMSRRDVHAQLAARVGGERGVDAGGQAARKYAPACVAYRAAGVSMPVLAPLAPSTEQAIETLL
jgi:hypothetical protein